MSNNANTEICQSPNDTVPPAMGERRARWGYGYQDKVATERTLNSLRQDLREAAANFEGVRLADLEAGRVDDFVLIWRDHVEGNSIKWSADAIAINWGELIGAEGLLKELAEGFVRLRDYWSGRSIRVKLHSNRHASKQTHHAQLITSISVAQFLSDHWALGPDSAQSPDVAAVWSAIATHVRLTGPELSAFVASCDITLGQPEPPGADTGSVDSKHYRKQFDRLHKAFATWVTDRPTEYLVDRDYLLTAIGYRVARSGLVQNFPEPVIPYERNQSAGARLKELIEAIPGGYVSVVGPAGVGKSTLVQEFLASSKYPFFVPYYAFLPNIDGNRDRAEALTFFQDVVERLDRFDQSRLSLGIADLGQGRVELRRCMSRANERYVSRGEKTVLLIDGLDHVMREVGLQSSVLNELPQPGEIPEGFIIVLSGQPQAFLPDAIPPAVAATVSGEARRVDVFGLSRADVHALVSRVAKATSGQDRDAVHDACRGNPLILTYILALFGKSSDITVTDAIQLAGNYDGQIDLYYQDRLSLHLQDGPTRRILGLLSRSAPSIPVSWLEEWPEWDVIEDIYSRVLAAFVRNDNGQVIFIHDSLVSFLKSATRSRVPGSDPSAEERNFYSILANRAKGRGSVDPVGRARINYLTKAGKHSDVIELLSSEWLRSAIGSFIPYEHVHPMILAGLGAACLLDEWGHVLRFVLLGYELGQRTNRVEPRELANLLLKLDMPDLALSQIGSGGRLLVEDTVALKFSADLWRYANAHNRFDLKQAARKVYLQSKPLWLLHTSATIDLEMQHDEQKVLTAWAEVAPLFEITSEVAKDILRLGFTTRERTGQSTANNIGLMHRSLMTAIETGLSFEECQVFANEVQAHGPASWRFATLLQLAELFPFAITAEAVGEAYAAAKPVPDRQLAYAWFMYRQGKSVEAIQLVQQLEYMRIELGGSHERWFYSDVTYNVRLRWLQELLGIRESNLPAVTEETEARVRVERVARELGLLRAMVMKGQTPSDLESLFRSLLLFHNRPVQFSAVGNHEGYILGVSKEAIYQQIATFAKEAGLRAITWLRDVFLNVIKGPASSQFGPNHRRYFARFFLEEGVFSREQAIELCLSSTDDVLDDEPRARQSSCLEIAEFLHLAGDSSGARQWLARAGEVSVGAESHKDYHMAHLAEWLARSLSQIGPTELVILDRFAQAVEIAGGSGGSDGAVSILQLMMQLSPFRGIRLAQEWIDRGVLNVSRTLEALITGAAKAQADPELLSAAFCELYSLISPFDTSDAAVAVLSAFPRDQRRDIAARLMRHVRTNALPSHRADVARALQDAILRDELDHMPLTQGLKAGRDDSSQRSTLYTLSSGAVETLEEVARRLSDPSHPESWSPNDSGNKEFDWWRAIKGATIKSKAHLEELVARFPPPDYLEADLLAFKAELLVNEGDRLGARELVNQALASSGDGSWLRYLDGAKKVSIFRALKKIDMREGVARARQEFSRDLRSGKISLSLMLNDVPEIFDVLSVDWPALPLLEAVNDYIVQVLKANDEVASCAAFTERAPTWSASQALSVFVGDLLACPVIDVGVAARRALSTYFANGAAGWDWILQQHPAWNLIQLEHLLAALQVVSSLRSPRMEKLRSWIEGLNSSESLAVRSLAMRICEEQNWSWTHITDKPAQPVILLSRDPDARYSEGMVGNDVNVAWALHQEAIRQLERMGLDRGELRSEFEFLYRIAEAEFPWADDERLQRWMRRLLVKHWLNPRAFLGRDAAMRVFGRRALSGQVPPGAEVLYDELHPIYDPHLELLQPQEQPEEFRAMDWHFMGSDRKEWLQGVNASDWSNYPATVEGAVLIGERTRFIRPEWEWPREDRHRGLIVGAAEGKDVLESDYELTYEMYMSGRGQSDGQIVVMNNEHQLAGPAYRWAALNAAVGLELGWALSKEIPFQWLDKDARIMVESRYWKNAWIWIEPPRFETLGEGWIVLARPEAIDAIRRLVPETKLHLWAERHSHGSEPYEDNWHLSRPL